MVNINQLILFTQITFCLILIPAKMKNITVLGH